MAVVISSTVVGHLPKKLSPMYSLFVRRGGVVRCCVAGRRRYSNDVPQGGLEIPCVFNIGQKVQELRESKETVCHNYNNMHMHIYYEYFDLSLHVTVISCTVHSDITTYLLNQCHCHCHCLVSQHHYLV